MHLYSTYFGLEGVPKTVLDKEYACLYYLSTWALGVSKFQRTFVKGLQVFGKLRVVDVLGPRRPQ